jgi:chain length determinant protein tyrosine kinase EpsG
MNPISASFPAIKRHHTVNADESSISTKTHLIGSSSSIGAILVDAGRLSSENADRILRLQGEQGKHFGEIAVELGLLTEEDVRFALSRQFNNLYLPEGDSSLSYQLVAAYKPFSAIVEKLRGLRSQLLLRWFDDIGRNALAIVSPGAGEGRSFIAANLAIVFTQLGKRTLLIDADLRTPRQHHLFKINNHGGLSSLLAGRTGKETMTRVPPLLGLSVLPAGAVPPNPQELLGRAIFGDLLQSFISEFDIVIIDTPAAIEYADAQTIAAHASAALIVARKDKTSMPHTVDLARNLQHTGTTTVGTVLNDF